MAGGVGVVAALPCVRQQARRGPLAFGEWRAALEPPGRGFAGAAAH
jgi:hypothetical protein